MNESIGKFLGNLAGKMHLYELMSKIGVEAFFYRKVYYDRIAEAKAFYEENESRVEHIKSILYDDLSKETFLKAIDFRKTHKIKDRPYNCKKQEYFNDLTPAKLLGDNEVLLDCGACQGDTVLSALEFYGDKIKKIIAFEPDNINCEIMQSNIKNFSNKVLLKEGGVWDKNDVLSFVEEHNAGSKIDECGKCKVNVYAIDSLRECEGASFIKMDIEGAELRAIEGAKNTIIRNRPILTICIYHSNEDMLSILEWMDKNLNQYRLYCRHHSYFIQDTIVYAIPEERYSRQEYKLNRD